MSPKKEKKSMFFNRKNRGGINVKARLKKNSKRKSE
jgi:hypothetical protein